VDPPINLDRIDFISAYCDGWCARCAFTTRCSTYAVHVATAMCGGDHDAGIELAVGVPPPEDPAEAARREAFLEELLNHQPTESEVEEVAREEEERNERVDESPITTGAAKVGTLAWAWLGSHEGIPRSDAELAEALEVAAWDAHLIGAKLHRALHGLDEFRRGEGFDDEPVQNDWNGSAKVALISIRRSIQAWTTISSVRTDLEAAAIAEELRRLEADVERAFPDAWNFIRPGFDS
jgi:hypothetical protein